MTGIIQNSGHKVLQINGMPDHVHILIGMRPTEALSGLMKKVKSDSSEWINSRRFVRGKFRWQEGFGAFLYSKIDLPNVIRYIQNQEQHHAKQTFREEYMDILRKNEVEFDDRYVFLDV
jgi:REP element-mobilizing transposase RayT